MTSLPLSTSMPTLALARPGSLPRMGRNTTITISVVVFHVAVLWAMHSGLLRRVADIVVPAEILVEIMAPAAQPTPPPAPQPKAVSKTVGKQAVMQPTPAPAPLPQPAPTPLALAPSATAPIATAAAPTALSAAIPTSTASTTGQAPQASPAPPAPARVELPSSDADYLNNPKPAYPQESLRRREQGRVVVQVFIGTDGQASRARLSKSSGYEVLDKLALETALKWRYVPGKRNGVPEGMEFEVPFNFQLPR